VPFLVQETAMGQRITRAKAKIKSARIPYRVPSAEDLPARVAGALAVPFLIFNEGYQHRRDRLPDPLPRPAGVASPHTRIGRFVAWSPDTVLSVGVLGLDHVQVAAPTGCEAAARRFFGDLLGLTEITKPEPLRGRGGVWFRLGAQQLHVGVEEPFAPARKSHPGLSVTPGELDALAARLAAAGAKVLWDCTVPDTRRFFSEDPWGNRIELVARP
jgi:catechol 2,3-dioxygenase-like lactoylglutathione lyase family enzyme